MKTLTIVIILCAIFATSMAAIAQAPPPPPAPARIAPGSPKNAPAPLVPGMANLGHRSRGVVVGPKDSQGIPRRVHGDIMVTIAPPPDTKIASVSVHFDDTLIGNKTEIPYQIQYNIDGVPNGPHQFKAIGLDENAKQVWTATTMVEVRNTVSPSDQPVPGLAVSSAKKDREKPPTRISPAKDTGTAKNYSSAKYGFSVRYPAGWVIKDKTATMKPSKPGNAWVSFVANAEKTSSLAVNIRRMPLDPGTDADVFAKFNAYVKQWERKTVLGSQSFATISTAPKEVIHRLIVIKDGYAWMLNCIDTSGKSPDASRKIFDSVVESLSINPPTQVIVTETKRKH